MSPYVTNGTDDEGAKRVKKISDVVDDAVEMVLQRGGEVFFIENSDLKQYDSVALILRYA